MTGKVFVEDELRNLEITLELLEGLIQKSEWNKIEEIAAGKLLSDMYMGYENVFGTLLRERDIRVPKGERWHTDLLERAVVENIAPSNWSKPLRGMLGFRHLQVHGYGHMMDEEKIRENSAEVAANHPIFVAHIRKILGDD